MEVLLGRKIKKFRRKFANDLEKARDVFGLEKGDNVVLTGGLMDGNTNMIKVERI